MNWGWDGSQDNSYYLPGGSWQTDNGTFQYEKKMIFDFK